MSQYRKAIAAFVTPFLGLPIVGWISGEVPFEQSVAAGAVIAAFGAILTYAFPNTSPDD